MHILKKGALSVVLSGLFVSCQSPRFDQSFREQINAELSSTNGVFAVAVKDLTSNEELLINEREVFHAASTMKTPVMIEVFKQEQEGKFSLTDSITIKNEFKSIVDGTPFILDVADDSEPSLYERVGEQETLSTLLYQMIISSSNLATNMIIERVDAKRVTETMRSIGATDIQVLRGVEDIKAYQQGLNNTTTAYDLMLIFERIGRLTMVSPEASEKMINILLDQRFNEIIPARLPENVRVAHKTGNITGVRHDSGIVFLPDGRKYVIVLLSKQLKDERAGIEAMARVSEMVYERMMTD